MSNTITSPNMNLTLPVPGQDPGPDYGNNQNASMLLIDAHNHSPGSGVQINPSGLLINSDLAFNDNNATLLRSSRYFPQLASLSGASDIGCTYVAGVDLYYNDVNGNQIQITAGGSVTGSAGTITGLPSGTAGAAFSAGIFSFTASTSTPANLNIGSLLIGLNTTSANRLKLAPPSSLSAGSYTVTLPPNNSAGALSFLTIDTSNNIAAGAAVTGGIIGTNLASNISLPSGATLNGKYIASAAQGTTKMVWDRCDDSANSVFGVMSFSLASTGVYNVSFPSGFTNAPVVTVSAYSDTANANVISSVHSVSTSGCVVNIYLNGVGAVDYGFSIIAVGN